jgi:acyl-CoA synthetase (AMP-forming)/AMP-acid ligase II
MVAAVTAPELAFGSEIVRSHCDRGFWSDETLSDIVERWAEQSPDRTVLIDAETQVTWAELRDRAYRVATALRARGLVAGDRVAVQLPNWHEFVVLYVALARVGAILVPIMPVYRHADLRHMLGVSGATTLAITPTYRGFDHLAMARELCSELSDLTHLVVVRNDGQALTAGETSLPELERGDGRPSDAELGPKPSADDGHIIGFTSGTEAGAKGCFHTFNTYAFTPRAQIVLYDFGTEDCELTPSPITHSAGLAGGLLKPMFAGGSVCFMEQWDPAAALDLVDRHGCTQATGATAFVNGLISAYDPGRHDASALRYFLCGGAPVPSELVAQVDETLPNCRVIPCFGQTEGLLVTSCTPEDPVEKLSQSDGRPLPGVELEIRGEDGGRLGPGEVGEIVYRSPGMMLEYWGDEQATAAATTDDGWRRTGDLGRIDDDGYLRVTGRIKEVIIRGGLNISTREVEEALVQHPLVAAAAVIGYPDPKLGERACAFVVARGEPPTLDVLARYLLEEQGFAKPKLPERLEVIDALPMTLTGKVQKFLLRQQLDRL